MGDTSKLILDPDLDSYYLMEAVVTRLPPLAEELARTMAGYAEVKLISFGRREIREHLSARCERVVLASRTRDVMTPFVELASRPLYIEAGTFGLLLVVFLAGLMRGPRGARLPAWIALAGLTVLSAASAIALPSPASAAGCHSHRRAQRRRQVLRCP